jgi:hypothetical protein
MNETVSQKLSTLSTTKRNGIKVGVVIVSMIVAAIVIVVVSRKRNKTTSSPTPAPAAIGHVSPSPALDGSVSPSPALTPSPATSVTPSPDWAPSPATTVTPSPATTVTPSPTPVTNVPPSVTPSPTTAVDVTGRYDFTGSLSSGRQFSIRVSLQAGAQHHTVSTVMIQSADGSGYYSLAVPYPGTVDGSYVGPDGSKITVTLSNGEVWMFAWQSQDVITVTGQNSTALLNRGTSTV